MGNGKENRAQPKPPAGTPDSGDQDLKLKNDCAECKGDCERFCKGVEKEVIKLFVLFILAAAAVFLIFFPFRQSGMLTFNNSTANATLINIFNSPIKPSLIKPVEGVGLFAVIYLFAQITERIVEPFSDLKYFQSSNEIKQKSSEIDLREAKIKKMLEDKDKQYFNIKIQKNALDYVSKHKSNMETLRNTQL